MLINLKKAFIIFSLLFILIMSLGAISASKDISDIGFDESNPESINSYCIVSDETNFINENNFENIIETDDKENKILKNSEKDSILSEDNPTNMITLNGGTFEDMQYIIDNAYENDTIIVNGTFIGNGIPINITKQVSINGIDEAIFDANGLSEIFKINSSINNVVLKNLKLINGVNTKYGAIYCYGANASVINCTFVNNSATNGSGGAIYCYGANASVINCTLVNNSATNGSGGAIYWNSKNGIFDGCTFVNNSATNGSGGAIYLYTNSIYSIFANCTFINNNAFSDRIQVYGGAIYSEATDCTLTNCSFINGSSVGYGGIIYFKEKNCIINNSIFINGSSMIGGAIYWSYGENALLKNCRFINNSATREGGAVYWGNMNGRIEDCSFINNSAEEEGGAIYSFTNSISSFITNCTFIDNKVFSHTFSAGGAVYWQAMNCTLTNCSFINNSALYGSGGSIFWSGQNGVFNDSIFVNNSAQTGKDIYLGNRANNGSLNNSVFINNASSSDYLIYWYGEQGIINNTYFTKDSNNIYGDVEVIKRNVNIECENISFNYMSPSEYVIFLKNTTDDNLINKNLSFSCRNENDTHDFVLMTDEYGSITLHDQIYYLDMGIWNMSISFAGDDNYAPYDTNVTITVLQPNAVLTIENINATVDYEVSIVANVSSNDLPINEGIVVFFDGDTQIGESEVSNGAAILYYVPTTAGEHRITANFSSHNFGEYVKTALLNVSKANVILSVNDIGEVYFSKPNTFTVNVKSNSKKVSEGTIKYYVDDIIIGISDVYDGETSISFTANTSGNFDLKVVYEETENYLEQNASTSFKVNKMPTSIVSESRVFAEDEDPIFSLRLVDIDENGIFGEEVNLILSKATGETVFLKNMSDSEGIISFSLADLSGGSWVISSLYDGSDMFLASSNSNNFVLIKIATTPVIKNVKVVAVDDKINLYCEILDEFGHKVNDGIANLFVNDELVGELNFKNHSVTDYLINKTLAIDSSSDLFFEYIPNSIGNYSFKVSYKENDLYKSSNNSMSFCAKEHTNIISSSINSVYQEDKYLIATLRDVKGNILVNKKISIKVGTIFKNLTTNSKGQVSVLVSSLVPNAYTATISFEEDNDYLKSSKTIKVVVKKATPKIIASVKTFRVKTKTKKYTITLRNNRNAVMKSTKVSIKVNGKTYKAKTNSKGKATFKLSKLTKKGTFKAVITYAGNKYYNKVTKKVKIKVKK